MNIMKYNLVQFLKYSVVFSLILIIAQIDLLAQFNYSDFSSTKGLKLVRDASQVVSVLRLTPAQRNQEGAAYYLTKQQIDAGFQTTFQFQITALGGIGPGADGFAFIIQNSSVSPLGNEGSGLGYDGIPNSIIVEFDTFGNDPSDNSISVHTRGKLPNSWNESYSLGSTSNIPNMSDGSVHVGKITYSPNSFHVYLDDLTSPVFSVSIDISSILNLDAGKAWVGFTSTTGNGYENHDLLSWSFTSAGTSFSPLPLNEEGDDTTLSEGYERKKLIQLRLQISETSENKLIALIDSLTKEYNAFSTLLSDYKQQDLEKEKLLRSKQKERGNINPNISYIEVRGIVESRVNEYAIVLANGTYYAIKSSYKPGDSFSGSIKQDGGNIQYTRPSGIAILLGTYTTGSGENSQKNYQRLTSEINSLMEERTKLLNELKLATLNIIDAEIKTKNEKIIDYHYTLGEEYLNKKEYDQAFKEFSYVQNIDANYKDISTKLDLANNKNHMVKKSNVYQIVSNERDHFLIGTSNGIFESLNGGKTWKLLKDFNGRSVLSIDLAKNKILTALENDGVMYSNDNGKEWTELNISYTALYNSYWDERAQKIKYKSKLQVYQPKFKVKELKLVPYARKDLIFIKFTGQKGTYNNGKNKLDIKKDPFTDNLYTMVGKEDVVIPESFISSDGGKTWIAFWRNLMGLNYYAEESTEQELEEMVDNSSEYVESPEEAIDMIIENISEKKNIDEDKIKIYSYSFIKNIEKRSEDIILILTNYGLFKTCWDCDQIEEIKTPTEYQKPISVFYDDRNPKTIILGFERKGLIISRDNGKTWEEI
ncbi:MAG: hypothetical protein A2057_06675 [Ignavibacteria bacterium GWA2_35_9]|nr:MAG: hypothetical protein A2057_06675 [Ignavibacteria bacterium GWA2_35_9]OGU49570.1 MAG: hypothetical protein A2080_12400 [Ignavibacteria bacterium GWC2_36_12]